MADQTLIYKGEAPARLVAVEGGAIRCERGVPFTVPESLAKRLLEQSDIFEPAPKTRGDAKEQ